MSGGVDSSTAAGLLVEAGHEVIGLAMKTHASAPLGSRACCTPDDMRDARKVADFLGIPFYVLNYTELFEEEVVRPFAEAYVAGRTPNPCIECNDKVKFRTLLARARLLGAERLATGHYAQVLEAHGQLALGRGVDRGKDQSYFLYRLTREQLAMVLFPVGGMTKDEVRTHARRLGLPVASKRESQEICFVGSDGYARTVEQVLGHGGRVGPILDEQGRILGHHGGVHQFTLGQRRGLGVSAPEPVYVTGIDAEAGAVRVGRRQALLAEQVDIGEVHWQGTPPDPADVVEVQQRYRDRPRAARVISLEDRRARLRFVEPQLRGAPGQAAVVYRGDVVLGGGTLVANAAAER